jgi:hypothetical protein
VTSRLVNAEPVVSPDQAGVRSLLRARIPPKVLTVDPWINMSLTLELFIKVELPRHCSGRHVKCSCIDPWRRFKDCLQAY